MHDHGSNPLDTDTDGDGLPDGLEVELGLDPTRPNSGKGGVGCDVSGGGPAPWALFLALPLALTRRRRAAVAVAAAATLTATDAQAQDDPPRMDIQRFDPNPQSATFTRVRDAEQVEGGTFGAILSANYGYRVFELMDAETRERVMGLVDHLAGFDLGVEYAPTDWLAIGASMPFLQISGLPEEGTALLGHVGASARSVGIGDITLAIGISPWRQRAGAPLNVALVPRVVLPTGTRGQMLGTGTVGMGADLAVGRRWQHFRFSVMGGYQAQPKSAALLNTYPDDELRYGAAVAFPLGDGAWELQAEWSGATVVVAEGSKEVGELYDPLVHTPMEVGLALLWDPEPSPLWLKVGAGPGVTRAYGTPIFRAFVQGGFSLKPTGPQDHDGDGLIGRADRCPYEAEDFDGFEDEDGCPDLDNDGDGIPDTEDACPNEAEDFDGFEDDDGCPDPDNDGDGILDGDDACPNEAEVFNGFEDDDGCPDIGKAFIAWDKEEIVIVDNVYFEFDRDQVDKRSVDILEGVALVLHAYPNITRVEIQGHTDQRGKPKYNLDLSQRRVDSVQKWLVAHGIAPERLVAKGYGAERPLILEASTEEEHAKNRRVQFVIVEMAPTTKPKAPPAE